MVIAGRLSGEEGEKKQTLAVISEVSEFYLQTHNTFSKPLLLFLSASFYNHSPH